jgi:molybdenum-dependent DNA-binding transcriptional regulator ModE
MDTNKLIPLLSDMAILVTVVEQGNFSKAAIKLGVTPSAVSRQISRLEDALGIKLLQRTTRQLALTESGTLTFNYCKQMIESAEQAVNASSSTTSTVSGLLRVAAPKSLANRVLRPLFVEFLKCYPDIQLHLKVTDRILDPIHDGVDFLIHINDSPIEALVNVKIGRSEQVLCASPDFLANHPLPKHPDDLKDLPIAVGDLVKKINKQPYKSLVHIYLTTVKCVETLLNRALVSALCLIISRNRALAVASSFHFWKIGGYKVITKVIFVCSMYKVNIYPIRTAFLSIL